MQRPLLVGIAGGSGAGKSWLVGQLQARLGPAAVVLSLDDFYRDLSHLPRRRRAWVNFDHPRAIDWALFEEVVGRLARGLPADIPCYDFAEHVRRPERRRLEPAPVVLIEGLWVLRRRAVRRRLHWRVFLDCPAAIRLQRRLQRDVHERGRSADSVRRQWRNHVQPMHERHVAGQRRWAGLCLESPLETAELDRLAARLAREAGVKMD
ncbi:MAG: uridine kinase [Verrucomicrobia bacterium]|nr:MAG: uridine kinase [Verrucomicrobiota bacterium]